MSATDIWETAMWLEMGFYLAYLAHGTMPYLELRLADPKFINRHEC